MKATMGKFLLSHASTELRNYVATGKVGIFGSVIRATRNGEIIGYLQETAATFQLLALANPATAPAAAISLVGSALHSLFDTNRTVHRMEKGVGRLEEGMTRVEAGIDRIETKLDEMDSGIDRANAGIDVLNSLGVANLAVSAAGVGISVAGFAVISAKIDGVRRAVEGLSEQVLAISAKIDAVRQDMIDAEFSELRSLAKLMDEGWLLADSGRAAKQWHEVAFEAQSLQDKFEMRAGYLLGSLDGYIVADPMLDAFALASGLRVAALAACNESEAARLAANDSSRTIDRLTAGIGAADLVRFRLEGSGIEPGSPEWALGIAQIGEDVRPLARKIREREAALATRAAPLSAVEAKGVKPSEWLRAAHEEKEAPVLVMIEGDGKA